MKQADDNPPRLLKLSECAKRAGRSERTWRRWVVQGHAPKATKTINGRQYWDSPTIEAWLKEKA